MAQHISIQFEKPLFSTILYGATKLEDSFYWFSESKDPKWDDGQVQGIELCMGRRSGPWCRHRHDTVNGPAR